MSSKSKFVRTIGTASVLVACGATAAEPGWEKLPALPEANGGFSCVTLKGRILVVGGTTWDGPAKVWLSQVHFFDPVAKAWSTAKPVPHPHAHGLAGAAGAEAWLTAGTTGTAPSPALFRITADGAALDRASFITVPAVASAGGLVREEFIVVGGSHDVADLAALTRSATAWNIRSGARRDLPAYPGPPIGIAASVVMGDELMVFGGASYDTAAAKVINVSAAHAYSVRENRWRALRSLPVPVRAISAVRLDDSRVYLAGGVKEDDGAPTDLAWIYHVQADQYVAAKPLPYRAFVGLAECGGFVYCIGGEDRARHRTDEFYRIPLSALELPGKVPD